MRKFLKIIFSIILILGIGITGFLGYFNVESQQERKTIESQIQQDNALWQQHLSQITPDISTPNALEVWGKQFDNTYFTLQKIDENHYWVSHFYPYHYDFICNGTFVEVIFTLKNNQVTYNENRRLGACL